MRILQFQLMCLCAVSMCCMSMSNAAFAAGLDGGSSLLGAENTETFSPIEMESIAITESNAASNSASEELTYS